MVMSSRIQSIRIGSNATTSRLKEINFVKSSTIDKISPSTNIWLVEQKVGPSFAKSKSVELKTRKGRLSQKLGHRVKTASTLIEKPERAI